MTDKRHNVLVLGAGGPIGRALERNASEPRLRLHFTSRRSSTSPLDVGDRLSVRAAVNRLRPRVIIDLSNLVSNTFDLDAAAETVSDLVDAAVDGGVERFIYASSAAVYGDTGGRRAVETDPLIGTSPYARLKILSEQIVRENSADTTMSSLALRIFNVFGPGCDSSLVNRLAYGPTPNLALSELFVRDYVHVDEVADALIRSAVDASVRGVLNIASGSPVNNLQLASASRDGAYVPDAPRASHSVGDPTLAMGSLRWSAMRSAFSELAAGHARGEAP